MSEDTTANRDNSPEDSARRFIERWSRSAAAERANYQIFLAELCDLLEVERPRPATGDFEGARKDVRARKIAEILATLAALGRARETSAGRFVA